MGSDREWDDERASFGWLGSIPTEIVNASRDVVRRWKVLSKDARSVARMPSSPSKTEKAKKIEQRRHDLILEARNYVTKNTA